MFSDELKSYGMQSGPVYATGILKARDILLKAADCKAQDSIREMTNRILMENNCGENEKAAPLGDLDVNDFRKLC